VGKWGNEKTRRNWESGIAPGRHGTQNPQSDKTHTPKKITITQERLHPHSTKAKRRKRPGVQQNTTYPIEMRTAHPS